MLTAKSIELQIPGITDGPLASRPLSSLEGLTAMSVFYIVMISVISYLMRHKRAQEKELSKLTQKLTKLKGEIEKTEGEEKQQELEDLQNLIKEKKAAYKPINISFITIPHNLIMCIYSLYCFVGVSLVLSENFVKLNYSVYSFFCDSTGTVLQGMDYWVYTFYLSKFVEYLDTVFLLLKAKPVMPPENSQYLLHIYHHAITAAIVWSTMYYTFTTSWTGPLTNAGVHILMYGYYFLAELNWIDRSLGGKFITPIQLIQFVFCMFALIYEYVESLKTGVGCSTGFGVVVFLLSNYLIFFAFFVKVYLDKKSERRSTRTEAKKKAE